MGRRLSKTKLDVCRQTRKWAAKTLAISLRKLLSSTKPISEIDLRDEWLRQMRKNPDIFPDGWYSPPPHGIGVLFATDSEPERVRFKTLRHEEYWPKSDIFLDKKSGFALFYCSPVDRKSGIIGDFGLNIYFGSKNLIKNNLRRYLDIIKEIFAGIQIGMKLSDIHYSAKKALKENRFTNEWWISVTDPTGTNYGHTIPGTGQEWTLEESTIIHSAKKLEDIISVINKKRKFTNAFEEALIAPGMAITIEPRAILENHPGTPTIYFHTIMVFGENGKKELLTDFDEIFALTNMNYMFK